ncbi:MAG: DNA-3-methyladenine glycosylase [Endomicrobiia bacterium]
MPGRRLTYEFFKQHPLKVAKLLLGKYLVRILPEGKIVVKIVETEAYGGKEDDACHVGRFGKTKKTQTLFGKVGCAYVYPVHINTYCLNVVCHKNGQAGGVLIRAAQPTEGIDLILKNKGKTISSNINRKILTNLLNGPGKLCKGLKIDRKLNGEDMVKGKFLYLLEGEKVKTSEILKTPRINIPYAKKSKNWLWRFLIKNSEFVSRI